MTKLIEDFIKESEEYGFIITSKDNKYKVSAVCNRCGKRFIKDLNIEIINVNDEDKIQCSLPLYCDDCKK